MEEYKVLKYDQSGKLLTTYQSLREAADQTGMATGAISRHFGYLPNLKSPKLVWRREGQLFTEPLWAYKLRMNRPLSTPEVELTPEPMPVMEPTAVEPVVTERPPMQIPLKSDEELKQLAKDLVAGLVFTDRHIFGPAMERGADQQEMLGDLYSTFMILGLCAPEVMPVLAETKSMVYEYLSEAGERSVNGRPMFMSFKTLHGDQLPKLHEYVSRVETALNSI